MPTSTLDWSTRYDSLGTLQTFPSEQGPLNTTSYLMPLQLGITTDIARAPRRDALTRQASHTASIEVPCGVTTPA